MILIRTDTFFGLCSISTHFLCSGEQSYRERYSLTTHINGHMVCHVTTEMLTDNSMLGFTAACEEQLGKLRDQKTT